MTMSYRAMARPLTMALIAAFAIVMLPGGAARPVAAFTLNPAQVWINEIHYDNTGTDAGEAIEVAGPAGTDLAAWSIVLYNGTGGASYDTDALSGTIVDAGSGYGVASISYPSNGIQNGAPDGIALVNGTTVVQFLSYEGTFAAVGGPANGLTSTDIGVSQGGSGAAGQSLRLSGTGSIYQDFTWSAEGAASFAFVNQGQTLVSPAEAAPSLTSSSPSDGATNVTGGADVVVTFSEPVNVAGAWFTISCTGSGAHPAVVSGGPTTFTLDPAVDFTGGETCTATVVAAQVTDQDANDPPDEMASNATISFTVATPDPCAAVDTPIGAIQGTGLAAAITGTVTVQGVVIGDYEGPAPTLRGFYLQSADAAADGDPATSEGIFVFNGNNDSVSNGDVVQVTGTAAEFQGQTQISASSIVACGATDTVAPTDVSFPVVDATSLERYEGMLVRVPETMTVTEHFQLGRFGQVVVSSEGRLDNPTAVVAPGAPALELQAQNNLRRIIVDDASQGQNLDPILFARGGSPLTAGNTLRGGDTVANLTGVMTYTWAGNAASGNAYRIRPIGAITGSASFVAVNDRPGPVVELDGTVRVAAMNLLNYFNTFDGLPDTVDNCRNGAGGIPADCRGADTQAEFSRQYPKTVAAILGLDADVVGVNEIENDGYAPASAIAHLVDQLNAATAPGTYAYIDVDAATGQLNALGIDAIKVGLIYQPAAVTPVGATSALNSLAFIGGGDGVLRSRPSLAQAFETPDGARFIVDVNHFKSKGSACNAPDAGDGQGNCNIVRTNAATELAAWLDTDPTGTGDADVLIMGDLNSYALEDPITVLRNAGYANLVDTFISDPYSYVFDGQWGYLDHALGSPSATAQVADVMEWHINSDEPSVLDYNTDFKTANLQTTLYAPDRFRVSDHDPIIVGLDAASDVPTVSAGGPYLVEELGSVVVTATGSDPTGDAVTYDWDLDDDGTYETPGQSATFSAGSLQAPQTVTVTVRITDENGQSSTAAATIDVIWDFGGFQPPVTPGVTVVKAGSSLPVKFSLAGDQGMAVLDGLPVAQRWNCTTHAAIGAPFAAAQSEPFSYDPLLDTYKFVWKTQKGWSGTCATLTVALEDGQSYKVDVRLTK